MATGINKKTTSHAVDANRGAFALAAWVMDDPGETKSKTG